MGKTWENGHKKGCHSAVALNEKLYAIGDFDGTRMVSTVDIFDPCTGSWMLEKSMNNSRGYFGTVVIRDEKHVIGGLQVMRMFWTQGNDRWSLTRMVKEGW